MRWLILLTIAIVAFAVLLASGAFRLWFTRPRRTGFSVTRERLADVALIGEYVGVCSAAGFGLAGLIVGAGSGWTA